MNTVIYLFFAYFFTDVYSNLLTCPDSHPEITLVTRTSAKHMREGDYLVIGCCPKDHVAIFFGKEGVGCCRMPGQRCVFTCKCRDNTLPIASVVPTRRASERCNKEKLVVEEFPNLI